MVSVDLVERVREAEKVNPTVVREISDIIKEAEHTGEARPTEKPTLLYSVPFAGVRYYYFEEPGAE